MGSRLTSVLIVAMVSPLLGCVQEVPRADHGPTEAERLNTVAIPRPDGRTSVTFTLEVDRPANVTLVGDLKFTVPPTSGACVIVGVGEAMSHGGYNGASYGMEAAGAKRDIGVEASEVTLEYRPSWISVSGPTTITLIVAPSDGMEPFELDSWNLSIQGTSPLRLGPPTPVPSVCITRLSGFTQASTTRVGAIGLVREATAQAQFTHCSQAFFSVSSDGYHKARLEGPSEFREEFEASPPSGAGGHNRVAMAAEGGAWRAVIEEAWGRNVQGSFWAWETPCGERQPRHE